MSPETAEQAAPAEEAKESETERPFSVNKKKLIEFTGDYQSEDLDTTCHLMSVNGRLVLRHWRNEDVILTSKGPDL
jgi:hypothetical protein